MKHTSSELTGCILITYNNTPSFTCFKQLNYFLFNSLRVLEPSSEDYQILILCVPSHMILLKTIKHEFQIAHISIWTSVSDVDMKFCTSARITYPPSMSCASSWRGGATVNDVCFYFFSIFIYKLVLQLYTN